MRLCLRRVSGWRGVVCCWGTWMMSDDHKGHQRHGFPVMACPAWGHTRKRLRRPRGCAGVFCGGYAGYAEVGDWVGG
jgi:hypothetical protein